MPNQQGEEAELPAKHARKISRSQLFAICIAQINEAIQITMPYTLAVYMVRDFLGSSSAGEATEQEVGRQTGLLAACFCAAQFVSSFPWGRASDKIGRKPMVVMSNLSSCLSVVGFGLSDSFAMAAVLRILGGFFNCTFVCLKSMIGESCSIKQQARPLSYLSLCWGVGTVIGPSLGGALSRPCEEFGPNFPFCQNNGLFSRRPFLLPCLAVGSVSFVAFVSSLLIMSETLPRITDQGHDILEPTERLQEHAPLAEMELANRESGIAEVEVDLENGDADRFPERQEQHESEEGDEQAALLPSKDSAFVKPGKRLKIAIEKTESSSRQSGSFTPREGLDEASAKVLNSQLGDSVDKEDDVVWYKNKETLLTITGYVCICLLYNLLDEVTPIFSSADRINGGLGLSTSQLAVPLSIGGISIFLWSMFFYPAYQEYFGVVNACRLGIIMTIPLCVGLGLPSLLNIGVVGLQAFLASVLFVKNIMATNAFTSAVMMVNAAAPQKAIGAVNGASQAAASFVRAVGPALGGLMWALSVSISLPGHQLLAFGFTGAGFLVPLLIFSSLKKLPEMS